jgi:acyl dehydratase
VTDITWTTVAANDAATSENKIHDDLVARKFGFAGGLVPGVTVYALATRPVVERFGVDWIERGAASFRLPAPAYEGDRVTTTSAADGGFTLAASDGTVCLEGKVGMADTAPPFPEVPAGGELPDLRPDASETSLAVDTVLAPVERVVDATLHQEFLDFLGDDLAIYRGSSAVVHPGWLSRALNRVISLNVLLGPWIHVGSDIQHHGAARAGDRLQTRGVVVDNYERKGHHFVVVDVAMDADGERPVLSGRHTAIWRPRQVA